MVSKRQRLARKIYKEEHPELFPKPEPTPPKDPNKKKKKKSLFKRKKPGPKDPNKENKKGFRKHPLRVPGMKPGDSCFICKAQDHIAKLCPQKDEWEKNKICLLCRHRGHSLKRCPKKNDEIMDQKLCYNCGETWHSLSQCPQPREDGGTKFANCFICNERGHLSKDCPKNTRGIYPKGGCCKICGGVTHLARDCPDKGKRGDTAFGRGGKLKHATFSLILFQFSAYTYLVVVISNSTRRRHFFFSRSEPVPFLMYIANCWCWFKFFSIWMLFVYFFSSVPYEIVQIQL
ncbi:hypothetical protein OIU77_007178 [Salix suchowensis]|uniref:CCHC-type domain-containing protein n=1 Tax=Salix suchowensis TaxID=1278906 RepID=A0ABQ9AGF6_9ROSI|nr:hypothetical protein OIU77_007178 [Salix suchowensis]